MADNDKKMTKTEAALDTIGRIEAFIASDIKDGSYKKGTEPEKNAAKALEASNKAMEALAILRANLEGKETVEYDKLDKDGKKTPTKVTVKDRSDKALVMAFRDVDKQITELGKLEVNIPEFTLYNSPLVPTLAQRLDGVLDERMEKRNKKEGPQRGNKDGEEVSLKQTVEAKALLAMSMRGPVMDSQKKGPPSTPSLGVDPGVRTV